MTAACRELVCPWHRPGDVEPLRYRLAGATLGVSVILAGCAQLPPGGSPGPAYGIERFSQALIAAGATVRNDGTFVPDPLAGEGVNLCVDGQQVAVYSFASSDDRQKGQARINPTDPFHVGNAIVEWLGTPRFWARDLIIVGYNGSDQAVLARITAALGAPFVVGAVDSGRGQGQQFAC
jgi:hypothetical protein